VRLGMNLLKKLILPLKDWISLLFLEKSNGWIASTLEGYMQIPSLDMIFPCNLTSSMENKLFFGFSEILNFLHL